MLSFLTRWALCLLGVSALHAEPWFTGPFLCPTPVNMEPGHPAIEPTVTYMSTYGNYNAQGKLKSIDPIWSINPLVDFQFGITPRLGFETLIASVTNFQKGKSATYFQDTIALLGYQISNDTPHSWVPDCRIDLQTTFPTGNYTNLRSVIESTGMGAFQFGPVLIFQKLFGKLSLEWSANYLFPTSVHVKNLNRYGGGNGTSGVVKPGQNLLAFFSGEYSITQNWAFAFDTQFFYQRPSRFHGRTVVPTGQGTVMQLSFAPEFEYNFSASSGLLAGVWCTLCGTRATAFASTFFAYVCTF